ncbi:MAG TPA: HRDC domain-containing protein, partial [Verrucomicrobiae bacterium]|nr:HRDC domain-containing protein [Verrucomicrobiae bacterium]
VIEPCGASCDVCTGAGVESLVARGAPERRPASSSRGARGAAIDSGPVDAELFERLRVLRKRLADGEGVPAYIVFSDAVLRQMAAAVPKDRDGLLALSGVGPAKLQRYGEAFLEVLRAG